MIRLLKISFAFHVLLLLTTAGSHADQTAVSVDDLVTVIRDGNYIRLNELLAQDPGLAVKFDDDLTACAFTREIGHRDRLELLQVLASYGATLYATDLDGMTSYLKACQFGESDVAALIEKSAGLRNAFEAAAAGKPELVRRYLREQPDLVFQSIMGKTVLYWAICSGDPQTVTACLAAGSNPQIHEWQHPLICLAAERNHAMVVKLLIGKGANRNVKDASNTTPLGWAVKNRSIDMVKLLYADDIDLAHSTPDARSILEIAATSGNLEILQFLISKRKFSPREFDLALFAAVREDQIPVLETLITQGADPNAEDPSDKSTLLHMAVLNRNSDMVKFLLASGADRNRKNKNGSTPRQLADNLGFRSILGVLDKP